VSIDYLSGTTERIPLTLAPHTAYRFDVPREIRIQSGPLYVVTQSLAEESYTYDPAMLGMPILPGMQVTSLG
jgi:hypothetical protein